MEDHFTISQILVVIKSEVELEAEIQLLFLYTPAESVRTKRMKKEKHRKLKILL